MAPCNKGTLFYVNPHNKFQAEFKSQGEQVKLIPRLIHKGPELLKDYFSLALSTEKGIRLSTKCGEKYDNHWVANNTLVELPYYCSAFTPNKVFLRPILMKRKTEDEAADSMLQRQAKAPPLKIRILTDKLRKKQNATVEHWKGVEADLQQHLEEHDEKKTTIWDNIFRWEVVSVIVAIVVGTTILLLVAKKAWNSWTSQFVHPSAQHTTSPNSQSHHDDERPERHGMANMEEVREQEQALLSRPLHAPLQIRTNPLPKRLVAIRDENIQGQLQLHQAQC